MRRAAPWPRVAADALRGAAIAMAGTAAGDHDIERGEGIVDGRWERRPGKVSTRPRGGVGIIVLY